VYRLIASDFDGTLTTDHYLNEKVQAALRRWKDAGYSLVLITGRTLGKVMQQVIEHDLFDMLVLENGGLIVDPKSGGEYLLGAAPSPALVQLLREKGVDPVHVGRSIISVHRPFEAEVLAAMHTLQSSWQVIPNKRSVMLLPPGIDKVSGLHAALDMLHIPLEEVVGVGDAENDETFLRICGYSVAVANALPELQQQVHYVTQHEYGEGVVELIDKLLATA
jgi:hydroxymethylpyrimidine pyrophosphatase-like HAD family hydrolase